MSDTTQEILAERAKTYGLFADHAFLSQSLKAVIDDAVRQRGKQLTADQKESLEMICHKIARIINGDPNYSDSWADIAGYARLVADRLEGKHEG